MRPSTVLFLRRPNDWRRNPAMLDVALAELVANTRHAMTSLRR